MIDILLTYGLELPRGSEEPHHKLLRCKTANYAIIQICRIVIVV